MVLLLRDLIKCVTWCEGSRMELGVWDFSGDAVSHEDEV